MFPTEADVEKRLAELRRRRDEIEAEIGDIVRYLELGRRLAWLSAWSGSEGAPARGEGGPARPDSDARSSGASAHPAPASPPAEPVVPGPLPSPSPRAAADEPPVAPRAEARRYGHQLMDAVAEALREAGRPLHVSEVYAAVRARGFDLPGRSPVAALNTRLWKRARSGAAIVQDGEATYRLREAARPPR